MPQTAELALVFGMITPLGWLERVPTYKEQLQELREKELGTYGFLGYPVLMTADIALPWHYARGEGPGEPPRDLPRDRPALQRDVRRRLPRPQALFTETPKVPGLDGRKMSKSYGNTIALSDSAEDVAKKIMSMVTDPKRARRSDPGDPETCNLLPVPQALLAEGGSRGRRPGMPDGRPRLRRLQEAPHPEHERRARAREGEAGRDHRQAGVCARGARGRGAKARALATETMQGVSDAMKLL